MGFAEVKREESFPHILSERGYPQRIKLAYEEALKEAERIGEVDSSNATCRQSKQNNHLCLRRCREKGANDGF